MSGTPSAPLFPLPPREAAVIAEIYRLFPGTREVTGEGFVIADGTASDDGRHADPSSAPDAPSPVTSQASLFNERSVA